LQELRVGTRGNKRQRVRIGRTLRENTVNDGGKRHYHLPQGDENFRTTVIWQERSKKMKKSKKTTRSIRVSPRLGIVWGSSSEKKLFRKRIPEVMKKVEPTRIGEKEDHPLSHEKKNTQENHL